MLGYDPWQENGKQPICGELLYNKGFLITDDASVSPALFPPFWERRSFGQFFIWHDCKLPFYFKRDMFLLGHAYHPQRMIEDEAVIIEEMAELNGRDFWEYEAGLTGVYVMGRLEPDGSLKHWSDCAGMLVSYYGTIAGHYYLGSHVVPIAEHLSLREDPYITKLKGSRYFRLFGNVLPADCSPYRELKRTVPNHFYKSDGTKQRFFPFAPMEECATEAEYEEVVRESAELLQNTLRLCARKWEGKNIAISLTGGKDSGVTLSAAKEVSSSFGYFSYISKPEEAVDAKAAAEICKRLSLPHKIIEIPTDAEQCPNYEAVKNTLYINGGRVGLLSSNEIRKRSILIQDGTVDVEIKSWVDEISRAYWNKKYNKKRFPAKPTGRYLATLYKVFLENRRLFSMTAKKFTEYIAEYMTEEDICLFGDWLTLWSWEFGHSAGEGQHMTDEQTMAFDVTVPFNNRHLIAMMLKPKKEDRIADRLQKDLIRNNWPEQAALGISVTNVAHDRKRALAERAYLEINSHLPF